MQNKKRKSLSFINSLSFTRKITLIFIIGILVPIVILNIVYYWQTERNVQEEMLTKLNGAMDDKEEKINSSLLGALSLSKIFDENVTLYQYLDYEYRRDLDYLIQYQDTLQNLFYESNPYLSQIRSTIIYTNNDTVLNGSVIRVLDTIDSANLGEDLTYVNLQPIPGEAGIYFRVANENFRLAKTYDSRSISIVSVYDHYRQYSRYEKLLRIELDVSYIEQILLETNLFENMFLTDSNGRVIVAANDYSNLGEMAVFQPEEMVDREDVMILSRQLANFPLTLYGIYSKDIISQEFRQSRIISLWISFLCLLFSIICMSIIFGNMHRRLNRLVFQSKEIANGNFIQSQSMDADKDEFSVLEKSMNQMSAQLIDLIDREYKAQIIKAEQEKEANQARFLALQSQVNPHFMFNALESIRLKSIVKGETETAKMIKYMAKMFRNLLEWENNIITLREEISFLDEYLHIQNYRFEDEFSYEIDTSEEALSCRLPKMILQPLVENACVHGVESLSDDRWVKVSARVENDWLELKVENNGGGIPSEKLKELRAMLNGETQPHNNVGLLNVYRRLKLYYGENFVFNIDSVQGKGTTCTIQVPTDMHS